MKRPALCFCISMCVIFSSFAASHAGWKPITSSFKERNQSVWCSAGSNIYTATYEGSILEYSSSSHTMIRALTTTYRFYDICGLSASDIYAFGPYVMHYDGTGWSYPSLGITMKSVILGIHGTSGHFFAVGSNGYIMHHDGTNWSNMTSPTTETLYAVWVNSPSDVYAAGLNGTILHYNGTSWSAMTSGTSNHLQDIFGFSGTDIWAAGTGIMMHYNGTSWSTVNYGSTESLRSIWGSSATDIFAVGDKGTIVHYDGTSWSPMSSNTTEYLLGVWGTSASNVFAVGTNGTMLRYDGVPATTTTTAASTTTTTASASTTTTTVSSGNTAPTAGFTVNPTTGDTSTLFLLEPAGTSDAEDPLSSLAVQIDWETDGAWDDSIPASDIIDHQYSADGTYTITIEVLDSGGLTDQAAQQVKVSTPKSGNTSPTPVLSVTPLSGDTSTTFTFDASGCSDAQDAASALEVIWDFDGDGMWDTSFSSNKTATWQYAAAGTYTAEMEVVDTGGQSATASQTVVVTSGGGTGTTTTIPSSGGNTAPSAVADVFPSEGTVDNEFEFSAEQSTDAEDMTELIEVRWDFEGDGQWDTEYDTEKVVLHRFEEPDVYQAVLEVRDSGGLTGQDQVEVYVDESGGCLLSRLVDKDPERVETLRRFREEHLAQTPVGRAAIRLYYRCSPMLEWILERSPALRAAAEKAVAAAAEKMQ